MYVQAYDLEEEKSLPGVLMAAEGRVFAILYQLARTEDPALLTAIRYRTYRYLLPICHQCRGSTLPKYRYIRNLFM